MNGLFTRLTARATRFGARAVPSDPFAETPDGEPFPAAEGPRTVDPAPVHAVTERLSATAAPHPPPPQPTTIAPPSPAPPEPRAATPLAVAAAPLPPAPSARPERSDPSASRPPDRPRRSARGPDDPPTVFVASRPASEQPPSPPRRTDAETHVRVLEHVVAPPPAVPARPARALRTAPPAPHVDDGEPARARPLRRAGAEQPTAVVALPRSSRTSDGPAPASAKPASVPEVHIRIDRIDVVAPAPAPSPATSVAASAPVAASPIMSLADFLRGGEATA